MNLAHLIERSAKLLFTFVLCLASTSILSNAANARTCEALFQQNNQTNSWIFHEASILTDVVENSITDGPSSARGGFIIILLYAKSVAHDLMLYGHYHQAMIAYRIVDRNTLWLKQHPDSESDGKAGTFDLPKFRSTGSDRVVNRTIALLDRIKQVDVLPRSPAMRMALGFAVLNAWKLKAEGKSDEAQRILRRAISVDSKLLAEIIGEYDYGGRLDHDRLLNI